VALILVVPVAAFAAAGRRIDFLHEHPRWAHPDPMVDAQRLRSVPPAFPALFSLEATKPTA
jgi:hypothetical protein